MSGGRVAKASWADEFQGRMSAGRAMLWTSAGIIALAGHAGAVAWALREPPMEMADSAPPPAIMIELAAEPQAINTEMNEISEQMEHSQEVKSDTAEPVEQPQEIVEPPTPQDDIPLKQPVEDVAEAKQEPMKPLEPEPEPEIDPIEERVLTKLEKVEVPIPVFRPQQLAEKPVEKPKRKKHDLAKKQERKRPSPASKTSTKAAAQVKQSNRNAANQRTAGMGFNSVSPAKWQSRLMAHLERRKRYPSGARSRGEQGTAYVRFRIDDAGNVLSASLARSSGFPDLDNAVVEMVRRASPVPTPPPGVNKTITAPVRFTVR
ncbi:protein TonB [Rhizobium sp. SG_E_25_P2]|nr:protein TonB [Rhizobium sp. SG_E_25_P2]